MCFTVAIIRKGVLMTVEEYYNRLPASIRKKKKNPNEPEIPNLYMVSGFSHPQLPVITDNEFVLKEWGLIPSWVKTKAAAQELRDKTLNAKGETIFEKPSFAQNILSRRCLLPVSGFFEWRDFNNNKYPYFIEPTNASGFLLGFNFRYMGRSVHRSVLRYFQYSDNPCKSIDGNDSQLKKTNAFDARF